MKTLRKSEVKEFTEKILRYKCEFTKKDKIEEDDTCILINNKTAFFMKDQQYFPTLRFLDHVQMKHVKVDAGAVRFVVSGADVMRPGITEIDDTIEENDPVIIIEQTHGKALAIGSALYSGIEMKKLEKGKCIKNLHYVGDEIWKRD